MFGKRKVKKEEYDKRLLQDLQRLKEEIATLRKIMKHSFDMSSTGANDLAIAECKYFYLLREARNRNMSAR